MEIGNLEFDCENGTKNQVEVKMTKNFVDGSSVFIFVSGWKQNEKPLR